MPPLNPASAEPATPTQSPQPGLPELAEGLLRGNPYQALKNVSCACRGGVLVLRGCVPSYYLKQVAQEVVARLDGVVAVDNQIQVVTPPPDQGRADVGKGPGEP
jgi:osmotically-inducible protein OsmY